MLDFLKNCPTPFHLVDYITKILEENGFIPLDITTNEKIVDGKYYINIFDTTIFAFSIKGEKESLKLALAHTDYPLIKIKPKGLMEVNGYNLFNGEIYGSVVRHSWIDRPLCMGGIIYTQDNEKNTIEKRLFRSPNSVAMIPGIAIHMDREINKSFSIDSQNEFVPIVMSIDPSFTIETILADMGKVSSHDILSFEAFLFPEEEGKIWGIKNEFLTATALDNLVSCKVAIDSLINSKHTDGINGICLFNYEEIGSRAKEGANSILLYEILKNIHGRYFGETSSFLNLLQNGFALSLDAAHGINPNYKKYQDPTHFVYLNKGFVIKEAANKSYATDGFGKAYVKNICEKNNIPYQIFVNNNNHPGGSTLGSLLNSFVPIHTVDIGVPLWSMHSVRETMGINDEDSLRDLVTIMFQTKN